MVEAVVIKKMKTEKKNLLGFPLMWGFIASILLLAVYFGFLSLISSGEQALVQFKGFWYWIVILTIGFGTQVGLFTYVKKASKFFMNSAAATSTVAVSGGITTGSMVACCLHRVTDFLPLLGLSAAVLFVTKFQTLFFVIGVLSNIIGINIMLKAIQEKKLYGKKGLLNIIMKISMKKMLYVNIVISAIIFLIVLFVSL